jgi:hypothetical protein
MDWIMVGFLEAVAAAGNVGGLFGLARSREVLADENSGTEKPRPHEAAGAWSFRSGRVKA